MFLENKDMYSDRYVEKEFKYVNDTIGFSLTFDESWTIFSQIDSIPKERAAIFDLDSRAETLRKGGGELIFWGHVGDTVISEAIVEELNLPLEQYYKALIEMNLDKIDHVLVERLKIAHTEMVSWVYKDKEDQAKFQEYLVRNGKYNIRLRFASILPLFEVYQENFFKIASTFRATDK